MSLSVELERSVGDRAFIGRQPIFRSDLKVFGYELLFRTGEQNFSNVQDGDYATANVITNALTDVGLDVLTDSKHAFVNLTRNLLLDADLSCLPPHRTVLEVLEDIGPDDAVCAAIGRLSDAGFTIALDDFVYSPDLEPLLELADIVKIEFPQIPPEDLDEHISKLRSRGVRTILAEKLETQEDFELCQRLGCDLFQGYFFCRPQVVSRRRIQSNVGSVMRLVSELQNQDISTAELAEMVRADASLSFKVLRFVNSAGSATNTKIESLEHAIMLLGRGRLRSLASMILLASISEDKPEELIKTAMMRAKLCELLAERANDERPERYFTLGLLSLADAMLDLPMEEVVQLLPLTEDMNEALVHRRGILGDTLQCATNLETGGAFALDNEGVEAAYVDALQWTSQLAMSV